MSYYDKITNTMSNPEGGMMNRSVNAEAVEDIKDYSNPAIRTMLEETQVMVPGDPITPEDYEATKSRAMVLAREKSYPISAEALLTIAFIERKKLVEGFGAEEFHRLSNEAIRNYVWADKQIRLTDEDIDMYRKSDLEPGKWTEARDVAAEGADAGYAAVNENDAVIAQAESPEEAMRRAQDESRR